MTLFSTTSQYVLLGILLGLGSYWNGAVTISGALIVGCLAVVWRQWRLLALPIAAVITAQLLAGWLSETTPLSPRIHMGFLASSSAFKDILAYYWLLLGVMPVILLASFIKLPSVRYRLGLIAFAAPFFLRT